MTDRKHLLSLQLTALGLDLLGVTASFYLAFSLRFFFKFIPASHFPPLSDYLPFLIFSLVAFAFVFYLLGLYEEEKIFSSSETGYSLIIGVSFAVLFVFAVAFFYRGASYSRIFAVMFYGISFLVLLSFRYFFFRVLKKAQEKGLFQSKVAILGTDDSAQKIAEAISSDPRFKISGLVGEKQALRFPVLGQEEELEEILKHHSITAVILPMPRLDEKKLLRLSTLSEEHKLQVIVVPDFFRLITTRLEKKEVAGLPLLFLKPPPIAGSGRLLKRAMDLLLGSLLLVLFALPMLVIALLVKYSRRSVPGPALYRQERIGQGGKPFMMYKFRTMIPDAEKETGPVWSTSEDPRITPLGHVLRKYSLDELPQLFNVLKGEMSLVGPRPERRFFVEQFDQDILRYMHRHKVKPGMTGWAQVNGLRGDCDISERTLHDLYYVENWSLLLDLKILLMTVSEVFKNKG